MLRIPGPGSNWTVANKPSTECKDAIEAFKNANELEHNACSECYCLSAIASFASAMRNHAVESCDKAIATADSGQMKALAHNLKGDLPVNSGDPKVAKTAESEFQAAVQSDPKSPVFHLNLAKALLRESKDDDAKQRYQECLNLWPR